MAAIPKRDYYVQFYGIVRTLWSVALGSDRGRRKFRLETSSAANVAKGSGSILDKVVDMNKFVLENSIGKKPTAIHCIPFTGGTCQTVYAASQPYEESTIYAHYIVVGKEKNYLITRLFICPTIVVHSFTCNVKVRTRATRNVRF